MLHSVQEGEAFASNHDLLYMEASAKTGENVEEAFITTSIKVLDMINQGVFNLNDEVIVQYSFLVFSKCILMLRILILYSLMV